MKNYHVCFVGPVERDTLDDKFPHGEGRIRHYNEEAFNKNFGEYPEICASGWGVTEEICNEMRFCWNSPEVRKAIIQSYLDEGKSFPSPIYEAYYLWLKTTHKI